MTGAHGLEAMSRGLAALADVAAGARDKCSGMGGGPSGFPEGVVESSKLNEGLAAFALLPLFSSKPPEIHELIRSSLSCESFSPFGGIIGSSAWLTERNSLLAPGSPELTISPDEPPCMVLV